MNLPTQSQIDAVKRYAINAVTTIMGFAGVAALLARYGVDSKGLVDLINGLGALFTALLTLVGLVGTVWTTLQGFRAASPSSQLASAKDNALKSKEGADALIDATISLPQVKTIVADRDTAQASPSNSVVSSDQVKVIENASGQPV